MFSNCNARLFTSGGVGLETINLPASSARNANYKLIILCGIVLFDESEISEPYVSDLSIVDLLFVISMKLMECLQMP